ncbi:hypothetical protein QVN97_07200 [Bacteroides caecigallinarum]|nr:hypothetical protein [Bacteroides caecigallinarum]
MRKWTYLVAALLMSGTAATFTSCIDNEEPAGIEAMRTAKADFYSAQARLKAAEAAWKEYDALIQEQKVKQEEIATKMAELNLAKAEAQNTSDIEAINMKLDELKASHEVLMQEYQTSLKNAQAEYQTALRDFNLIVARLNSDYTKEYARILGNITANRTQYNKLAADLIDAQYLLNQYSERTLDTTAVEAALQRNKEDAQKTLDNLLNQKKWLEEINGADNSARVELANNLNQEIRKEVEEYNKNVKERQLQKDKLAEAQQATLDKQNALLADFLPKFRETKSETYAINAIIQNEFISSKRLENESFVKKTELTSYLNGNVEDYYTLANGNYELKVEDTDVTTTPPNANNNTASTMVTETATLMNIAQSKFTSINTPQLEANADAQLPGKQAYMNELASTYTTKLGEYNTAKATYLTARTNFMIDATANWYDKADKAIDDYNALQTDEKTDAVKEALVTTLKTYAPIRKAYDGFVYTTGTGTTAVEVYTTLTKDNVEANMSLVLGNDPSAFTATENSAKGAFEKISTDLFGMVTLVAPVSVETEYQYDSSASHSGLFGDYFDAYAEVQEILEAKAWKALYEEIRQDNVAYTAEAVTYRMSGTTVLENAEYVALKKAEMDIENEIAKLEDLVGNNPGVVTVEVANDDNLLSTINLKVEGAPTNSIGGSLGTYIHSLNAYYGEVAANNNDFTDELDALKNAIELAEADLFTAKNEWDEYKAGAWEMSTASGSITIGNEASIYATVTVTDNTNPNSIEYTITYYYPDGTIWYTNTIYSDDPDFDTNFNDFIQDGASITVTSTNYLKVAIEAYKAKVENINAQMADLDAQLLILQKELAAFVEVLNEVYPEAVTE